jgi:hypothetical protein
MRAAPKSGTSASSSAAAACSSAATATNTLRRPRRSGSAPSPVEATITNTMCTRVSTIRSLSELARVSANIRKYSSSVGTQGVAQLRHPDAEPRDGEGGDPAGVHAKALGADPAQIRHLPRPEDSRRCGPRTSTTCASPIGASHTRSSGGAANRIRSRASDRAVVHRVDVRHMVVIDLRDRLDRARGPGRQARYQYRRSGGCRPASDDKGLRVVAHGDGADRARARGDPTS